MGQSYQLRRSLRALGDENNNLLTATGLWHILCHRDER